MAVTFSKSADIYLKIIGAVIGLGGLGGAVAYAYFSHPMVIETGYQPVQPVPYSHKLHAGNLGMDCTYCHYTVEKAAYSAIPTTEVCMNCHVRIKPQSQRLQKVRESYATGESIPWIKIHKLPDYVYFNHS